MFRSASLPFSARGHAGHVLSLARAARPPAPSRACHDVLTQPQPRHTDVPTTGPPGLHGPGTPANAEHTANAEPTANATHESYATDATNGTGHAPNAANGSQHEANGT